MRIVIRFERPGGLVAKYKFDTGQLAAAFRSALDRFAADYPAVDLYAEDSDVSIKIEKDR